MISIYYHPTEFVTTEFWDAVNFAKGADRERADWRRPRRRTEADSERCYGILRAYVAHMKSVPGVRFATAREMLQLYGGPVPQSQNRAQIAAHLAAKQTFLLTEQDSLSAADMLLGAARHGSAGGGWTGRRGLPARSVATRFPARLLSAPKRIRSRSFGRISGCPRKSGSDPRSSRSATLPPPWPPDDGTSANAGGTPGQPRIREATSLPIRKAPSIGPSTRRVSVRPSCSISAGCRVGRSSRRACASGTTAAPVK